MAGRKGLRCPGAGGVGGIEMSFRRILLGSALAVVALGAAQAAAGAQVIISNVGVVSWGTPVDTGVPGHGSETSTGILFDGVHADDNSPFSSLVFCADLEHNVYVMGGQHLVYDIVPLTTRGDGGAIDFALSNKIGHLALLGQQIYKGTVASTNVAWDLAAIQGAIWSLEYNSPTLHSTSGNAAQNAYIDSQIAVYKAKTFKGGGYALELKSTGGTQNQVFGLAAPEPETWALMIGGFGAVGAALRRRRMTGAPMDVHAG